MMPTMPPDNNKITLKIIEAIRAHPVLYISDIKGPAIKLQEFRQKVWKRISDELGLERTRFFLFILLISLLSFFT